MIFTKSIGSIRSGWTILKPDYTPHLLVCVHLLVCLVFFCSKLTNCLGGKCLKSAADKSLDFELFSGTDSS